MEPIPDSSSLRVSANTLFESGIPPARLRGVLSLEGGVERVELALANVTRTEANLSLLMRSLKHLTASALAAREANDTLTHELDELRAHLARSNEEEHALRYRMGQLEQLLDVIRHESAREREFLIAQQDSFFVEIMTDHDRQIADLRRTLKEALTGGTGTRQQEIDELTAQRDQAREYATRCERERDAAWHELANSELTPVPPTIARRTPSQELSLTPNPTPPAQPSPVRAAMERNEFSELTDEELRGAAPPAPRAPSSPRAASSPSAAATAIGAISVRAVQVPTAQVSASRPAGGDGDDDNGDRLTTAYSVSGQEITD